MKKQITRLLSAALLLLALCIAASAADTGGTCGPSARWSFDSGTGTLTISGSGAMEDYESRTGSPWRSLSDSIRTVVIGDQITQIGKNAFSWTACSAIQFGKTVRSIGAEAFRGCENLSGDLTIPNSVQTIGDSAFANCTGLTGTLTLGSSLQTIGSGAFAFCPFSGDLVIPDSVTEIGIQAFRVRVGAQPETQGTLTLGKNLRTIGAFAFRENRYTGSLTIPDSVVEIGEGAFSECENLTGTLTLGKSLRTIGDEAFYGDPFTGGLMLPDGLTSIGASAFSYCEDLGGILTIPDSVETIGEHAFSGCDGFGGTLTLPDSVKTVGKYAFYLCEGFTGLKLSAGLTKIEEQAFAHMYGLKTEVVIPEGVTEIGKSAFSCSHMPSVRLPSSLRTIREEAFFNCFGLNSDRIAFPEGLETIEDEAFASCEFQNAVILPASIQSIGKKAFSGNGYYEKHNDIPIGVYFRGSAPQLVGTLNANCSFPSDWTLYYLPGTSGWKGETYEGYKIAPWDGETRWDNVRTNLFWYGMDISGSEIEASWTVNTDTGKLTLTDDLTGGCAAAVSYDAEGRVTRIGVLRTKKDSVVLNLQDTCRLFLLNASFAPRLSAPVIINNYLSV